MMDMLSPEKAWHRLEPYLRCLPEEEVPRRAATGRVLSRDLSATVDVPAVDVSAMDGYAIAGPFAAGSPLPVLGTVAAGDPPTRNLEPGQVVRIMTGAPVPRGADRVVPVEETDDGDTEVTFSREADSGAHIRRRGEIVQIGAPLLRRGSLLLSGALSLLATHGISAVPVPRRPRVFVLTTGDELVAPDSQPRPGQLRDSHTDFLLSAGRGCGAELRSLGIAPDRDDILRQKVETGLDADVLLVSGGSSMGKFDLVAGVLEELGCEILFDAVAIQPGKPLVVGRHSRGLVFGLPGNPASAMVCFWLFVRPALRRLMGLTDELWGGALGARLTAPLPGARGRDRFLPAEVSFHDGEIHVTPVLPRGSHDIAAYSRGTAMVRIRARAEPAPAGDRCEVLPLEEWRVAGIVEAGVAEAHGNRTHPPNRSGPGQRF